MSAVDSREFGLNVDPLRPQYAVFLDRDGTIIEDTGFVRRVEDVRLLPGAAEGLRELQDRGYRLIVVSNQSGLARGIFGPTELEAVKDRVIALLRDAGICLTDYLYCPHHPQGTVADLRKVCSCRKGAPGMILTGAHRHGISLTGSWMIGDKEDDVRAGQAAGLQTLHIGNGAANLLEASRIITRHTNT